MNENNIYRRLGKMTLPINSDHNLNNALSKMYKYLHDRGQCESPREIRRDCCQIIVKGDSTEGSNIYSEVCRKLDVEELDDKQGFANNYPFVENGTIVRKDKDRGTYYVYFQVADEDEAFYDLEVYVYHDIHDAFFLEGYIFTKGIPKFGIINNIDIKWSSIKELFLNPYSKTSHPLLAQAEFSEKELAALRLYNTRITEGYLLEINRYAILSFIAINYLQSNQTEYLSYLDNDIYRISHIERSVLTGEKSEQEDNDDLLEDIINLNNDFLIIDDHSLLKILNLVVDHYKIKKVKIAVGFAFRSGLRAFEDILKKIQENGGKSELIIGSLQHFRSCEYNNRIDKNTVIMLNDLVRNGLVDLYTYSSSFYHGKFYYLENEERVFAIVGSSNISNTAFYNNYEVDILYATTNNSKQDIRFLNAYEKLIGQCSKITDLDPTLFDNYNWNSELDAYKSLHNRRVSRDTVLSKIKELTDEDQKYRLNLWLTYNPTEIYEDLEIESFKDYFLLTFSSIHLAVFESYVPNNAYYVFLYKESITNLLDDLKQKKKTEMTHGNDFLSRGYHIKDKDKLKTSIEYLFLKLG